MTAAVRVYASLICLMRWLIALGRHYEIPTVIILKTVGTGREPQGNLSGSHRPQRWPTEGMPFQWTGTVPHPALLPSGLLLEQPELTCFEQPCKWLGHQPLFFLILWSNGIRSQTH